MELYSDPKNMSLSFIEKMNVLRFSNSMSELTDDIDSLTGIPTYASIQNPLCH